jgi:hypothetical protein
VRLVAVLAEQAGEVLDVGGLAGEHEAVPAAGHGVVDVGVDLSVACVVGGETVRPANSERNNASRSAARRSASTRTHVAGAGSGAVTDTRPGMDDRGMAGLVAGAKAVAGSWDGRAGGRSTIAVSRVTSPRRAATSPRRPASSAAHGHVGVDEPPGSCGVDMRTLHHDPIWRNETTTTRGSFGNSRTSAQPSRTNRPGR